MDDLIDVIEGNRRYIRCLYVYNKIDVCSIEEARPRPRRRDRAAPAQPKSGAAPGGLQVFTFWQVVCMPLHTSQRRRHGVLSL